MKTNRKKSNRHFTHEGSPAQKVSPYFELKRTVLACMLWEDTFYENGQSVTERIQELIPQCDFDEVAQLTRQAKDDMKLRHVPLFMVVELFRHPERKRKNHTKMKLLVHDMIRRPDEMGELIVLYWNRNGNQAPLPKQMKLGIAEAFHKFDKYQFSKWDRDAECKIRDVMFLTHPKPQDEDEKWIFEKLADRNSKLPAPNTWETRLSAGEDKKQAFTNLLEEGKMPGMACLMNLRNMVESGVDRKLIAQRLEKGIGKALPFRFITAAKHCPWMEEAIEKSMFQSIRNKKQLPGTTLLVVDISGSMIGHLAGMSKTDRVVAANGVAILIRELSEEPVIYATAGNDRERKHATDIVPARHGFALCDAIWSLNRTLGGGGIFTKQCMDYIQEQEKHTDFDRVIVFTDEQDCDLHNNASKAPKLGKYGNYMINVGTYKNGISYGGGWTHIDGWSEAVIDYIREYEEEMNNEVYQ